MFVILSMGVCNTTFGCLVFVGVCVCGVGMGGGDGGDGGWWRCGFTRYYAGTR